MKIILISLLCLILIGITSYSYAQGVFLVDSHTKVPEVMLQLELRDSDGNLVSYIEAKQIIAINHVVLNKFLDNQNQKKLLIKDGKAYEKIQWQGPIEKFSKKHTYSGLILWSYEDGNEKAMYVRYNSFQSQPGDTLTVYWTIVRPVS